MIPTPWQDHLAAQIAAAKATQPKHERVTSMCLGIADFTCEDCPGEWCSHECHNEPQESA